MVLVHGGRVFNQLQAVAPVQEGIILPSSRPRNDTAGRIFILFVEDALEEGIQPLTNVRDRIEEILAGRLARQAQSRWLERLRKDSYVKYY